ncbi:hypothetical protein, partial [Pseudomonas gingeri]|uniref:hypothetical protein n=1 Tax=Pseudomonas gingeri TaxID=117681 RepID=UPI001C42F082
LLAIAVIGQYKTGWLKHPLTYPFSQLPLRRPARYIFLLLSAHHQNATLTIKDQALPAISLLNAVPHLFQPRKCFAGAWI